MSIITVQRYDDDTPITINVDFIGYYTPLIRKERFVDHGKNQNVINRISGGTEIYLQSGVCINSSNEYETVNKKIVSSLQND